MDKYFIKEKLDGRLIGTPYVHHLKG